MPDMSPDQAIQALRGLPEERQRAVLARLSPEVKQQILGKLSSNSAPAAKSPTPEPGFLDPHPSDNAAEAFLRGGAASIANFATHPVQSIASQGLPFLAANQSAGGGYPALAPMPFSRTGQAAMAANDQAQALAQNQQAQQGKQMAENPAYTAGGVVLPAVAMEGAVRTARLAPRVMGRVAEAATGTGPTDTAQLVEKTKAANDAAAAKASEKNQAIDTKRAAEVRSYFDKTQAARQAAEERSGVASRKSALESGVRTLSDRFQDSLKSVRDKAATEADAKYHNLNAALEGQHIQSEALLGHLLEASEKIKGSMTEPTIFKDIEKTAQNSETIPYEDLQGYYSELGRELKKGTLPGDIYTAYSTLQDAIGNEMQQIADANGVGPQLLDARTSWRNLKQTFYDPKSPLRKALDAKEAGAAIKSLAGKDRSGIEALAKYDPQLARQANTIRGYQEEAAKTRVPAESTRPTPKLAAKPAYVTPELQKIGTEEIRGAKTEALAKRSAQIQRRGSQIVSTLAAYRALSDAFHGNFGAIPGLMGEAAAGVGASYGIARILESPKVVDMLTRPTARDVAQIPPELLGDLKPVVQQAQARGIKVSPMLLGAVAGASQGANRLGPRQNATDEWASNPQ